MEVQQQAEPPVPVGPADDNAIYEHHQTQELASAPQPVSHLYDGHRVAVVVPYVGNDLPVWWNTFAEQARHNEGLVDWIIMCDQVSPTTSRKRKPKMRLLHDRLTDGNEYAVAPCLSRKLATTPTILS